MPDAWKTFRISAKEILGERSLITPTRSLYQNLRMDMIYKNNEVESDGMSVYYCNEHYEELVHKYSEEELTWLRLWGVYFEASVENIEEPVFDKSGSVKYGKVKDLTKLDIACYLTIRGDIPKDLGEVSYAAVLFNLPLVVKRINKKLSKPRIRQFIEENPQSRIKMEKREIPLEFAGWKYNPIKCMYEGRLEERIQWASVLSYFTSQFSNPEKVYNLSKGLLARYLEKYGIYPNSVVQCLNLITAEEQDRVLSPSVLEGTKSRLHTWIQKEKLRVTLEATRE